GPRDPPPGLGGCERVVRAGATALVANDSASTASKEDAGAGIYRALLSADLWITTLASLHRQGAGSRHGVAAGGEQPQLVGPCGRRSHHRDGRRPGHRDEEVR